MARFGKIPVIVPESVKLEISEKEIKVTGPKGVLTLNIPYGIKIEQKEGEALITTKSNAKSQMAMQGTTRSHLMNAIKGVTEGWEKTLEIVGAGFRAEVRGSDLVLAIGYSHPVTVSAPDGIKFGLDKGFVKVEGINKDLVGQVAANLRAVRPPEPYKGKGIKYTTEVVRRKAGKAAAKTTGA